MAARNSPQQQQQQKYSNGIQVASMSCVLCGGPFRVPTPFDRVSACLTGPSSSFKWLTYYYSMPAEADKRRRGEPPAFFCHKDCRKLLQYKLYIMPQHHHIWPFVKEQMAAGDNMPDSLRPDSYLGIADVLDSAGPRSSATMLSSTFTSADSWMLHSPLVCTKNATRILTIWQPKFDSRIRSLAQHLSRLLLSPSRSLKILGPRTPSTSGGGAGTKAASAQPDLLDIMLANTALHHPQVVAKLHLTSKAMSARLATALAGRLHLCFASSSTESVVSLSMWLAQHAALLSTLEVGLRVCCCNDDEAGADSTLTEALVTSAPHAPSLRMRAFTTTYSKTQLLSNKCMTLPCVQHLTHLSIPDICTEAQIHCLPPKLCSLEITKSTATVGKLQLISQQCPHLSAVVLGYSLWPNKGNTGSLLLDHALNGWVLLPIVELRFIGCRLPRGFTAQSMYEPPYMSRSALGQLVNLPGLSRLVFDGCCVDANVRDFAAVLSRLSGLKALDLADPSGVLTAEYSGTPRCFVDSTATLLQAASRKNASCAGAVPVR